MPRRSRCSCERSVQGRLRLGCFTANELPCCFSETCAVSAGCPLSLSRTWPKLGVSVLAVLHGFQKRCDCMLGVALPWPHSGATACNAGTTASLSNCAIWGPPTCFLPGYPWGPPCPKRKHSLSPYFGAFVVNLRKRNSWATLLTRRSIVPTAKFPNTRPTPRFDSG